MLFSLAFAGNAAADPVLDTLVAAYPDHLAGHRGNELIWKDGTRMPVSDGRTPKTFEELLNNPDILDQFAYAYPLGTKLRAPGPNQDPGRIRYDALFRKMYGDCERGEVMLRLKPVAWMPNRGGGTLMVTTVNDVADKLAEVVRELERLPASMTRYLVPSAGTYNCRPIAETKRLSVHAYGAAIDISTKFSDYWLWTKAKEAKFPWKNRIPLEIVEIFERHGFVWGGKWFHFDTMHFEYRPEIIALAKKGWPHTPLRPVP